MTPELEQKLLKRFPQMYKGYYKSMQETCMCWGFSHDDGWFPIIWQLSLCIEDALNYSWWEKTKFEYKYKASRKWSNVVEKVVNLYIPKKYQEAARSSWMDLPEEDQKDQKKRERAVRHMNAGKKLVVKYREKFFNQFGRVFGHWYPDTGFEVVQVKEKYGTLRFYTGGTTPSREVDDKIQEYVSFAEMLSECICETCGKPGSLRPMGWYKTLCYDCCSPHQLTDEEMERFKTENPMEYIKYASGFEGREEPHDV